MTSWLELDSAEDVASAAADTIEEHARHAIAQRGEFKLVLAGGTTPLACYKILAQRDLNWEKWKLFYGDERCLPANDAERNHQMVMKSGLTDNISQHFIIPAELGSEKGAESYRAMISDELPFDVVLLGMGEDGHTASLFPGLYRLSATENENVIAVEGSPKPPSSRVSLTKTALQNCHKMLVLITGESKKEAMGLWKKAIPLPVARVADCEQAVVLVERALMTTD